jgi:endonuclease YncB( thermonuclease family)
MDKKYALFLALCAALLAFGAFFLLHSTASEKNLENVTIERIIDGDTLKLADGRTVRLLNINAPEKNMPNAMLSASFMKSFENKTIEIEITGADKYKRSLARLYAPKYLNLQMVNLGFASNFLVDDSELGVFAKAEEEAVKNGLGIWNKSYYFGCFDAEIDKSAEIVKIRNNCQEINVNGWYVKDESRKVYRLSNIALGEVALHSGRGEDNSTDIFWNLDTDVWNNDRDTLYFFTQEGGIVHHESYGY